MPAPPRGRGGSAPAPGPAAPGRPAGPEPIGATWERKHADGRRLARPARRRRGRPGGPASHGTRSSSGLGPVPRPDRVLEHRRRHLPGRAPDTPRGPGGRRRTTARAPPRPARTCASEQVGQLVLPAGQPTVGQAEVECAARRQRRAARPRPHDSAPPDRRQPPGRLGGRAGVRGLAVGGPEQPQVGAAPRPAPRAARRRRAPRRPGAPRRRARGDRRARPRRAAARPRRGSQSAHRLSSVPAIGSMTVITRRPRSPTGRPGVQALPAELLEVTLGVALPEVQPEVGDPAARGRRRGPAARPRAPGRCARRPRWRRARRRPGPGRGEPARGPGLVGRVARRSGPPPRRGSAQAAARPASTAPACARACGCSGRRSSARWQRAGDAAGAAPPHGGHPDGAVPEAWPAQVGLRSADRRRRDVPSKRTDLLSLPAIAAAGQVPSTGVARRSRPGRRRTAGSRRPAGAVTRAWSQVPGAAAPRLGAGRAASRTRPPRRGPGRPAGWPPRRPTAAPGRSRSRGRARRGSRGRRACASRQPGQVEVDGPEVGEQGEVRGCPALARAAAGRAGHLSRARRGSRRAVLATGSVDVRPEVGQDAAGRGCRGRWHQRRLPRSGAVTRRNPAAGSRVGIYVPASRRPARRRDR